MVRFSALPVETRNEIASYMTFSISTPYVTTLSRDRSVEERASQQTFASLCLVNKAFNAVWTPWLYKKLCALNVQSGSFRKELESDPKRQHWLQEVCWLVPMTYEPCLC